jgi:hypothetical protein
MGFKLGTFQTQVKSADATPFCVTVIPVLYVHRKQQKKLLRMCSGCFRWNDDLKLRNSIKSLYKTKVSFTKTSAAVAIFLNLAYTVCFIYTNILTTLLYACFHLRPKLLDAFRCILHQHQEHYSLTASYPWLFRAL